jgi:hypothetical protein
MSRFHEPFHLTLSPTECVALVRVLTDQAAAIHKRISDITVQIINAGGSTASFSPEDETLVDLWEAESLTALARATMEAFCQNPQPRRVEFVTIESEPAIRVSRGSEKVATIYVPCYRDHGCGAHLQPYISRAYNGDAI